MVKLLRKKIQEKFSSAARNYDRYALIQRDIGDELFECICNERRDYKIILDIGTGTANILLRLGKVYPQASIFGLDISYEMLKEARSKGLSYLIQADAEFLPFRSLKFDLIISNLVYQWLPDLSSPFYEVRRLLQNKGRFYFSLFGEATLYELRESIAKVRNISEFIKLPSKQIVYNKLKEAGFSEIEIVSEMIHRPFSGFFALLNWLKFIGANQRGIKFYGLEARGMLCKVRELYEGNFRDNGRLIASFEKIIVKAEKK
jgi:malonyl-CoA O-methyltransferase